MTFSVSLKCLCYSDVSDLRLVTPQESSCINGVNEELKLRYELDWLAEGEKLINPYIEYLRTAKHGRMPYKNESILTGHDDGAYYRPVAVQLATKNNLELAAEIS